MAAGAAVAPMPLLAQEATPAAARPAVPGYGIVRVRVLATPELGQAVFPDVMYRFLPMTAAIPGYYGYLFAWENENPAATLSMTLLADEAAAADADAVAKAYVAEIDPRLTPETPLAEQGPVRIFALTERTAAELPPFLSGCQFTFRQRMNAPDTDIEGILAAVQGDLIPVLSAMDGFVLYGWLGTPEGRIAFNIWETAEQLAAGDQAVADFVAANPIVTAQGETVVHAGTIGFADVLGGS